MATQTLLITYNLNGGDDQYEELFKKIKGLGKWWHDASKLDSVWFVRTEKTLEEANDEISREFRKEDNRFVVDITGRTWHGWMPKAFWKWINATT